MLDYNKENLDDFVKVLKKFSKKNLGGFSKEVPRRFSKGVLEEISKQIFNENGDLRNIFLNNFFNVPDFYRTWWINL